MKLGADSFRCATAPLELYSVKYEGRFKSIEILGKWMGWSCFIRLNLHLNENPRSRSPLKLSSLFLEVRDPKFWEEVRLFKIEDHLERERDLENKLEPFVESLLNGKRSLAEVLAVLDSFKVV